MLVCVFLLCFLFSIVFLVVLFLCFIVFQLLFCDMFCSVICFVSCIEQNQSQPLGSGEIIDGIQDFHIGGAKYLCGQPHITSAKSRGGGGALGPHFGRYVPRQSEKWVAPEPLECENAGLWSGLEREIGGRIFGG